MFKKALVAAAVSLALTGPASANINSEMQSFFNELGAYGNVSGPQMLKGQTGTAFAGGSLYMRAPQRNYNLFNLAPPSIKAGCGGIDLFAGSFSFLNAEQLTALLQNLANNAIGVAFQLAIESISPELAGLLKWAQDQASKLNNFNLNSCQLATGLVTAAWPDQEVAQRYAAKSGLDPAYNFSSDSWKSRWNLFTQPPSTTNAQTNTQINADARNKERLADVNVVWQALNRINISDSEMKEMMMSLVGTVIIRRNKSDDSKPDIQFRGPPQKLTFKDFIGDPASASTTIKVMKCPDNDCLNPGEASTTALSFAKYSRDKLQGIVAKINSRTANTLTEDEYKFLQGTFVPVWKIVTMGGGLSEPMVDSMSQLIAMDLAFSFFNEVSKELQKALHNNKSTDSAVAKENLEKMSERLTELRQEAHAMMTAEAARVSTLLNMQQSVARIHTELRRGLSEPVRVSMQAFPGAR